MKVYFLNVSSPRELGDRLRDEVMDAAPKLGIVLSEGAIDRRGTAKDAVFWVIALGESTHGLRRSIHDALERLSGIMNRNFDVCVSVQHQELTGMVTGTNICRSPVWTVLSDPRSSPTSAPPETLHVQWVGFGGHLGLGKGQTPWHGEQIAGMRLAKTLSLIARGKTLPRKGPVGFPQKAMVEVCRRCNLRCVLCPVGNGTAKVSPDMEITVFRRIVDLIAPTVWKAKLYNYGEPLLHPQFPGFVRYAKEAGIEHVEVSSNGMLLDEQLSTRIILAGLDAIHISIDGADQQSYATYRRGGDAARIWENVKTLRSLRDSMGVDRPAIEIQCLATRYTENRMADMNAIADDAGADSFRVKTFNAFMSGGNLTELGRTFLPENRRLSRYSDYSELTYRDRYRLSSCQWPCERLVVNSDGTAVPCCYDFNAVYRLGSFRSQGLDWWLTDERRRFIEQLISASQDIDMCARCPVGVPSLTAD